MNDNAYIEGLAKIIQKYAGTEEIDADITAQAITDWHREHGLRVVPEKGEPEKQSYVEYERIKDQLERTQGYEARMQYELEAERAKVRELVEELSEDKKRITDLEDEIQATITQFDAVIKGQVYEIKSWAKNIKSSLIDMLGGASNTRMTEAEIRQNERERIINCIKAQPIQPGEMTAAAVEES